jgi:proton-dependent oligopeptide transporter, POT family
MTKSHPKGLWYLISIYMWEYFSYYGMRAILVLYLIEHMMMQDNKAYSIYGAYTSLVYLTPLFGGIIADKLLGFKNAVIIGALLMVAGHILLGIGGDHILFYAMSFIICGYGFFKSNMSCLLGELYSKDDPNRDAGFILLYLGGNVGGIIAPIVVGFIAHYYGWHTGFSVAGIGMFIGLVVFLFGRKYIPSADTRKFVIKNTLIRNMIVGGSIALILVFSYILLNNMIVGYILFIVSIITGCMLLYIWIKGDSKHRKNLNLIFLLMLFAIAFWVFDQQTGSSIVMFIARNVNTHMLGIEVPAAVFNSINPFAILIGGSVVAYIFSKLKQNNQFVDMMKFFLGLLLLTLSFLLLFIGAKMATFSGKSSPIWVIIGLIALGCAELFIDPLALSQITSLKTKNTGFIAAAYMLFTGSVANYIAAKLADLSSSNLAGNVASITQQATLYKNLFYHIFIFASVVSIIWLIICFYMNKTSLLKMLLLNK